MGDRTSCPKVASSQVKQPGSGFSPPAPVHEAAQEPGTPLDAGVRGFFEPRFGHDFSQVRVHTDPDAGRSAREIDARAFTSSNRIVFAPGEYAPHTGAGRHLLAHELAHVVQQRRSGVPPRPGVSASGDFHERHAGAVADAAVTGRDLSGLLDFSSGTACPGIQRDTPGTNPPPPTSTTAPPPPLDYDRGSYSLPPLPAGQTAANLEKLLNDKIKAGQIASFATAGVTKGSNAEIFVLFVIWSLAEKGRWGTEADVLTAIDWPAKPTDPAPQGRVTVRIDTKGAASAELVGAGPVPAVAQTTVAAGSTKLKTDYGFAAVKDDGTATWSPADISDVVAALAMIPATDKPALKGVELIRVLSLGAAAGEFSTGGAVAKGATAPTKPYLKLADSAFPKTALQFYGGTKGTVPASFQTILHEVGHAVENQVYRAAAGPYAQAVVDTNVTVDPLNKSVAALKPLTDQRTDLFNQWQAASGPAKEDLRKKIEALDAKIKPLRATYNTRRAAYVKAEATRDAKKAEADKTRVSAATIKPLETDAAAKKASAATALTTSKAAVQALQPDEVTSSAAYTKAVDDTATAIATFSTDAAAEKDTMDNLESVVLASVAARDAARDALAQSTPGHKALGSLGTAAAAQDAWLEAERIFARARTRSLRLQKFIDLVTTNNIQRFTKYSKDNWLLKPQEFYAEAYSLWLVDPQFLETNYKVVYDFFQNGDYAK